MFRRDCNQRFGARQLVLVLGFRAVAALAQPDGGTGPWIVDRVVAEVEGQVVTQSQLEFEARVLLINAGGLAAATGELDDDALTRFLGAIVNQRLVTLEADKLDAYPLEPGELDRAVTAFRGRFSSEARFRQFLELHEADLGELGQVLRRSLRAQRVLEGKLRLKAQVSELEARQYASEHPELKGVATELVRQRLAAQRFDALVKEELAQRRRQSDVRLLGPYAPALGPSE